MCACACVCVHVHVHARTRVCALARAHVCVCVCVCVCVFVCTRVHMIVKERSKKDILKFVLYALSFVAKLLSFLLRGIYLVSYKRNKHSMYVQYASILNI